MPKSLALGNGNILICFDKYARIRDFYYHYVGLENHVGEPCVHRVGVFCNGVFSWIRGDEWDVKIDYKNGTMVSEVNAVNRKLEIELRFSDVVHSKKNILIRKVSVCNLSETAKEVKLFFHQQFKIYNTERKDTGYYDPDQKVLIHYEGRRVFIIAGDKDGDPFDEFSIGNYGIEGKEGTWRDAEDGILEGNPIEHGPVDSVIGFSFKLKKKEIQKVFYWIGVAKSIKRAIEIQKDILKNTPEALHQESLLFWKNWASQATVDLQGQDERIVSQFNKSLFVIRTHTGNKGDIIASGDSSMLQYGHGTYAFVWPRDAAFITIALCKAGMHDLTKPFFDFCRTVIDKEGFFKQKFQSDRSVGSTWHPWFRNGKKQYPIQEDETALVLIALWKYYLSSADLEFIEELYKPLIKKAADFMCKYRDENTNLPKGSYDLWERKYGTSTFTSSAVYGGLNAAGNFAALLGHGKDRKYFSKIAEQIKSAIIKNFFNEETNYFYNLIILDDEKKKILYDNTIDLSSFYGIYRFNILKPGDKKLEAAHEVVKKRLYCKTAIGGVTRFENDEFHRVSYDASSNPWFITTLWCAQYEITCSRTLKELEKAKEKIDWAIKYAIKSGIMSEQIRADNGMQISAAPLAWSHAEFVATVVDYVEKQKKLKGN
ncbi:MAG: glycoside hydrolase family 15 protein [Patescibacteria group bacterium]|nr:glycoside hydrolase family 15 protein [Patescibacteria group bacterium]